MTEPEQAVHAALVALETTVQGVTAEKADALRHRMADLDAAVARLPVGTDPGLLHYLHKRSYAKARRWLEGRDAENHAGSCRPAAGGH